MVYQNLKFWYTILIFIAIIIALSLLHYEGVDDGVVGGEVHVLIVWHEFDGDFVRTFGEADRQVVGHAPVIPVAHTALRHDYSARFDTVDEERAHCAFVFGIDRAVAVGIAQRQEVFAVIVGSDLKDYRSRVVVNFGKTVAGYIR